MRDGQNELECKERYWQCECVCVLCGRGHLVEDDVIAINAEVGDGLVKDQGGEENEPQKKNRHEEDGWGV